jgi:hypothetical protein
MFLFALELRRFPLGPRARTQDTLDFCRDTLGAPDVLQLLQARFVCWAGSIAEPEAHRLATSLGPLAYPFRCVESESRVNH